MIPFEWPYPINNKEKYILGSNVQGTNVYIGHKELLITANMITPR